MIFDTHSHYTDTAFDNDRDDIISSFEKNNISGAVIASAEFDSIPGIIELCNKYDNIFLTLGIHPNDVLSLTAENRRELEALIEKHKPVAIGEIGLEYHYEEPARDVQREAFIYQLGLAKKYDLPVIIHSREADQETFDILKEYAPSKKGVIHCYSGSAELAKEYVKLGWFIGVGGVVTFKNGRRLKETVEAIPLENIVLETDCPYLAPTPHRGERNSSLFLPLVAEEIARLKNTTVEEVENVTEKNAERLYNIKLRED